MNLNKSTIAKSQINLAGIYDVLVNLTDSHGITFAKNRCLLRISEENMQIGDELKDF